MNTKELAEQIRSKQVGKETVDDRMYNLGLREAARLVEAYKETPPKWNSTAEGIYPQKPNLSDYEYVDCLVVYHGEILMRPWNCEHLCWDREDRDDFFCKPNDVTHWMPVPEMLWPELP